MSLDLQMDQSAKQTSLTSFQLLQNCQDAEMPKVTKLVKLLAKGRRVLVTGETGTGKEIVARALHECGSRPQSQLVVLDCTNFKGDTLRSELFGHEIGAFTNAVSRHEGLFAQAHCGTAFLDEIGEIPPREQGALLRVIQHRTYRPVGSNQEYHSDFNLIAATRRDLRKMVDEGTFREDLYFRLQTFGIEVPPLRLRMDDIIRMANYFVDTFAEGRDKRLSAEAEQRLLVHQWPGNVRELENAIERAVVFSGDEEVITAAHLNMGSLIGSGISESVDSESVLIQQTKQLIKGVQKAWPQQPTLENIEKLAVKSALSLTDGNMTGTSAMLGIDSATLYRKRKKWGLDAEPSTEN